jgi:hypothetical protein
VFYETLPPKLDVTAVSLPAGREYNYLAFGAGRDLQG